RTGDTAQAWPQARALRVSRVRPQSPSTGQLPFGKRLRDRGARVGRLGTPNLLHRRELSAVWQPHDGGRGARTQESATPRLSSRRRLSAPNRVPITGSCVSHHGRVDNPGSSPDHRVARGLARWLGCFSRVMLYIFWGWIAVTLVVAAVNGAWILAGVVTAVIVWRLGLRALVRWNQREVEAWEAHGRAKISEEQARTMSVPTAARARTRGSAVDIEEFYDGDPRRRAGEERSFGMEWNSAADPHHRWDLFWNAGTEELYLMAKPVHSNWVGWNVEDAKDDLRALEALEHRIVGELEH